MKYSVLALVLLSSLGCVVSTGAIPFENVGDYPEVAPDDVDVYRTVEEVPARYERIALLNSTAAGGLTTVAAMIASMQKEAGKVGANAIILNSRESVPVRTNMDSSSAVGAWRARREVYLAMPLFTLHQGRPPENKLIVVDPKGEVVMQHYKYGGNQFEGSILGDGVLRRTLPETAAFLMVGPAEGAGTSLVVVLNWHQELLERVPIP